MYQSKEEVKRNMEKRKLKQPNIIYINIDDMGWRDLKCTGSTFYETPNIDRMCEEGMIFENAYASCPVCSPSRASFQTGKHPARVGITDWIDESGKNHPLRGKLVDAKYAKHMELTEKTIAHTLKENGYSTWHVGKWHLGTKEFYPEHFGYDINIGGTWWGHPQKGYFSPYGMENLTDGPEGEYLTDRLTDEAIRLIENAVDKPFFMNLCHFAVHEKLEAKEKDIEKFRKKAERLGLDKVNPFVEGEFFPTLNRKDVRIRRRILQSDPVYAAMIWNLDENIGRLMQALKKCGKDENTVVFFTSDNGGLSSAGGSPTCNLPAREGKGWMYEGGLRVPLIVRYPVGVAGQSRCTTPVITMDAYPTILELCGIELVPEQHKDGVSIVPLLQGNEIEERPLFWHYPHYGNQGGTPGSSVLYKGYKLIEFYEDNSYQLYQLNQDFSEMQDISEENTEMIEVLKEKLSAWKRDVMAKLPTVNAQ